MAKDIKTFIKLIRRRLRDDWDTVIAVSGEEGVGKSTLGLILGTWIDDRFDLDRNIAYLPSFEDIQKKFNEIDQFGVFDIDEAAKQMYKLKSMDPLQIKINEMYMTERKQNKCTFLMIPRFRDLNEYFRNHRVKIWIHVIARGQAIAYIRDDDKDAKDPWHIRENEKIKERAFKGRMITERSLELKLEAERKTPNYFFDFVFDDVPDEMKKEYLRLHAKYREYNQKEEMGFTSKRMELYRQATKNMLRFMHKEIPEMSEKQLAEVAGISQPTVSRILKGEI